MKSSAAPAVGATGWLALLFVALAFGGAALHTGLTRWPLPAGLAALNAAYGLHWQMPPETGLAGWLWTAAPAALWLAAAMTAPRRRLVRALQGAVLSYRDGDFSTSLVVQGSCELAELTRLHNALGDALRVQRQQLAQRELLLDTVVQHTPLAIVLTDAQGRVNYANLAARHFFDGGRSLSGADFAELLGRLPAALRDAIGAGRDSLFSVPSADGDESYHLLVRKLTLQGQAHRLHVLRRMTRELSRQEVASWKRVIRVLSHELNNSLAPISSLAHSGAELVRRGEVDRLAAVFAGIAERSAHLHRFVDGYATFAKLPAPQPTAVAWEPFLDGLRAHYAYTSIGDPPAHHGWFDAPQVGQALINLLKNAHEAGGAASAVALAVHDLGGAVRIEVADRGAGMVAAVLAQAVLPFYSTKRDGAGLGLALVREIAEAHGGRILLSNRDGGGLLAAIELPVPLTPADAAAPATAGAPVPAARDRALP